MKIFNWVHRRFNQKDGSCDKNINDHESDHNEQYLMFDDWKEGILAIGTFGYQPLIKNDDENELIMPAEKEEEEEEEESHDYHNEINPCDYRTDSDQEEEEDEDANEETNPLMYAVYAHDYDYDQEMKMEERDDEVINMEFEFENGEMSKNATRRRTTLAELFSADSDQKQDDATNFKHEILVKEKTSIVNDNHKHDYGLLSFPKKLIGGEARPVHKLHRLMRRMLKRKIHPELGVNKDIPNIRGSKCGINESASLLPTEDAII